jgi:adenylosuccinate synthase
MEYSYGATMNIAILGAVWGDEGKGAITHHMSKDYDWVVRFGGGANAGHTIYRDGVKYVHNLLPSVDFRHKHIKSYLGAGMVIDLEKLRDEVLEAEKHYPGVASTIYVDKDAFLVTKKHKEEDAATNAHIGSTNRGIGPAYKDKVGRCGYRVGDLFYGGLFEGCMPLGTLAVELVKLGIHFKYVMEMEEEFKASNILFEGAQGVLLDINHGIYPYVSSSDCCASGIVSSGFGFVKLAKVYGVAKAYTTKVGAGPFPTEYHDKEAEDLRELGNEYGATTGRPRRVGCIDLPALKYACKKGGITDLIITKFDILNNLGKVKMCLSYKEDPFCGSDFFKAEPIYSNMKGWTTKNKDELHYFINAVEKITGIDVQYISWGTDPEDIIKWH